MKHKIETRCPILEIQFFSLKKILPLKEAKVLKTKNFWPRIKFHE